MSEKMSNCSSNWRSVARAVWALSCVSCCRCLMVISLSSFCCCSNHCCCCLSWVRSVSSCWTCCCVCWNCACMAATSSSVRISIWPKTFSSCLRWLVISRVFSNASCPILAKILELVRYSSNSPRSVSRAFKNAVTSDCASKTARVNCSKLSWVICWIWLSTALLLSATTTPSVRHLSERCTLCNFPLAFSRARLISQRAW